MGKFIDYESLDDGRIARITLNRVEARNTLPAFAVAGRPSAPITLNAGRHARFKISSVESVSTGPAPFTNGNLE